MPNIRVKISEELHRQIRFKSVTMGKPITEAVREKMTQWVEEDYPVYNTPDNWMEEEEDAE